MDLTSFPFVVLIVVALLAVLIPGWIYRQNKKAPEKGRGYSPKAVGCGIVVAALVSYGVGIPVGIVVACSAPSAGNLCGLAGFFFVGPVFAMVAAIVTPLVLWLIARRAQSRSSD